jgi:hypothetical protein
MQKNGNKFDAKSRSEFKLDWQIEEKEIGYISE